MKSYADEIADLLAKELGLFKSAYRTVDFEYFKKTVEDAKTCDDLKILENWIESGRVTERQDEALLILRNKQKQLCSK